MSIYRLDKSAKFYIYRNLRTGGFSIKHRGLVVDRGNAILAKNINFKVNESGREKVLKEKRKNVHAYSVVDSYEHKEKINLKSLDKYNIVTYNPYIANYFTCNGKKIEKANQILFFNGKCYLLDK